MPDPVAMSSAEANYNQAYIATKTLMHIPMVLNNYELMEEDNPRNKIPLILEAATPSQLKVYFQKTNKLGTSWGGSTLSVD